jgi:hypothetical protein
MVGLGFELNEAFSDRLRLMTMVRCPLGQRHPTSMVLLEFVARFCFSDPQKYA